MIDTRTRTAVVCLIFTLLSDLAFLFFPRHVLQLYPGITYPAPLIHSVTPTHTVATAVTVDHIADKVLRLHIIADNDSEEAQNVKLLVRDAVCASLSPLPPGIDSKEKVCAYLDRHLSELVTVADEVLQQQHCDYRAHASIERRFFPLKTYGAYTFPPGEYDALCITLGSGQGQNWWCLAFPSLCLLDGTYAVTDSDSEQQLKILLTDEEYEAILIQEPQIRFRFRLLEWLKGKHK